MDNLLLNHSEHRPCGLGGVAGWLTTDAPARASRIEPLNTASIHSDVQGLHLPDASARTALDVTRRHMSSLERVVLCMSCSYALAHGGGLSGNLRRPFGADQLGPVLPPVVRAQMPTAKPASAVTFDAHGLIGAHVFAPGQALVEVLLVDADLRCELLAFGCCDFHAPQSSESTEYVKRFALVVFYLFA